MTTDHTDVIKAPDRDVPAVPLEVRRGPYPQHWEADVVLKDGSTCHLRPILADDDDRLRYFHAKLSPETIYYRFFAPYPELTDQDVERFTRVDHVARVALVATIGDEIVGIGRYDKVRDLDAEVAFTVRDDYQGRGLGSVLLEHLAEAARERGFRRFVADVLPQNRRMTGTFGRAGYRVAQQLSDGVVKLAFEIQPNSQLRQVAAAREQRASALSMERLLAPRAIAVVGASAKGEGLGNEVLHQLLDAGYAGRIVAIHPSASGIEHIPAYSTLQEAPGPLDLAIIAVPVQEVPRVVDDCAAAGVHGLVVMSAGYSDAGSSGTEQERRLVATVRGNGMRLVGPNSLGLMNTDPHTRLRAAAPNRVPPSGRVALFCQSAPLALAALDRMEDRGLGLSSFVAVGNRADVSVHDVLQYLLTDLQTQVALLYLETMADPRKFIRVAGNVSRTKPVVVVRSGRTSQAFPLGPRVRRTELPAAAVDQLIDEAGVIDVHSLGELMDVGGLLACQPLPRGRRVAIVGDSRELVMLAADTCATAGLHVVAQGPVQGEPGESLTAALGRTLRTRIESGACDSVIVVHVPAGRPSHTRLRHELLDASRGSSIPLLAVLHTEEGNNSLLRPADASGVPVARHGAVPYFGTVEEAVGALRSVVEHSEWRHREQGVIPYYPDVDSESARDTIARIQDRNRSEPETIALSNSELSELLGHYGIDLWPALPAANEDQAVAEADELGWPVALKSVDPRISNRGVYHGVRLNLESEAALRAAFLSLSATLDHAAVSQLVVQRTAPPGTHCVIRSQEDSLFGPVVSFGVGGTVAELLGDHAFQAPPLTDVDAARMIRHPRSSSMLFGHGGNQPADVEGLQDLLVRVGLLADHFAEIARLDLNPVMATSRGPVVLAAAGWLRPSEVRGDAEARRLTP